MRSAGRSQRRTLPRRQRLAALNDTKSEKLVTTRNRTLTALSSAVVVLAILAGPPQARALDGQLGILTPETLAGNNPATGAPWAPGDQYRFAFFTSGTTTAQSADIDTYNEWVQGLANATTVYDIGADEGVTWKVIGSTNTIDARDNTSTNPHIQTGHAIFLLDGSTVVANNYADLWDGGIQSIIDLTEQGTLDTGWPWTGTYLDGTLSSDHGASYSGLGGGGQVGQGRSDITTEWIWRTWTGDPPDRQLNMYALSDPLTIAGGLLTLEVNKATGGMALLGHSSEVNDINFYEITSEANSLDATNWSSLADQDYEGSGPPDGSGSGWEEAGGVGAHALAEGFLLGNTTIGVDQSVSLGMGYDVGVGAEDLAFKYRTGNGAILEGLVEYVSSGIPGDTDLDGDVDFFDYLTAKGNFGMATGAGWADGDFDRDGDVDFTDYITVKGNFGWPTGAGAPLVGGAVPESAALTLLLLAAPAALARRAKRP